MPSTAARLWPFFDLRIVTPRVELRYADDGLLEQLADFRSRPVSRPGLEPWDGEATFYMDSPEAEWKAMTGEWGARSRTSPDWWHLAFAVFAGRELVGQQNITGADFRRVRTVNTWSMLALEHHGKGIGKEMRAAALHLAFAGLDAERAESDAFDDNVESQGVSRSLGYQPNGTLLAPRPSGAARMTRFLLTREQWQPRRRADIQIDGLAACLPVLGLDPPSGA